MSKIKSYFAAFQAAQKDFLAIPLKNGKRNGNALNAVALRLRAALVEAGSTRIDAGKTAQEMRDKFRAAA